MNAYNSVRNPIQFSLATIDLVIPTKSNNPTIETSEDDLKAPMNSPTMGGITIRIAWGKMIKRIFCSPLKPSESAASNCPFQQQQRPGGDPRTLRVSL